MDQINFEQIYQDYYNKIYLFVKKRVLQEQDAEELTADIFTAVYKNLGRYRPEISSLRCSDRAALGKATRKIHMALDAFC